MARVMTKRRARRQREAVAAADGLRTRLRAEESRAIWDVERLDALQGATRSLWVVLAISVAMVVNGQSSQVIRFIDLSLAFLIGGITALSQLNAQRAAIDWRQALINEQRAAMERDPTAQEALTDLLWEREGVSPWGAQTITRLIASHPEAWLRTVLEKQHHFTVDVPISAWRGLVARVVATLVVTLPLALPFFVIRRSSPALVLVVIAALLTFVLAIAQARWGRRSFVIALAEMSLITVLAGIGGWVLGRVFVGL